MPCYKPIKGYLTQGGGWSYSPKNAFTDVLKEVPCGQCIGCKLERARQWAVRMVHEQQMHKEDSIFLTLTYNDKNLPANKSLDVKILQKFMKKLRKHLTGRKLRFYACGEYGEDNQRPHYHLILFGYFPDDATFVKDEGTGKLYTSPAIEKIWNKGYILFSRANYETCAYVARYITKKITGELAKGHYGDREPEFNTMSRRPGIGFTWLEQYGDETLQSGTIVSRGHEAEMPRYYKKKLKEAHPEIMRKHQKRAEEIAHTRWQDNSDVRRKVREIVKKHGLKINRRKL